MVQQKYSLHYFDGRGVAEPIRLLLNYVNQPFEDVRIRASPTNLAPWNDVKHQYFYGKLPVLFIDDGKQQLAQSAAILRYLGEKFGLAGKDDFERAKVNELIDFHKDTYSALTPYMVVKRGLKEGNLEQLRNDVLLPNVAQIFPIYVMLLKQSSSGFFLPSGLSIVDFLVSNYMYNSSGHVPGLLKEYPELQEHLDKVLELPQLREYIATRNETSW